MKVIRSGNSRVVYSAFCRHLSHRDTKITVLVKATNFSRKPHTRRKISVYQNRTQPDFNDDNNNYTWK